MQNEHDATDDTDEAPAAATPPDPAELASDPEGLKAALGRTSAYLEAAGLPFEEEEFDDEQSSARREEAETTPESSEGDS